MNRLGLVVAAISALAVLLVFGVVTGIRALVNRSNPPPAAAPAPISGEADFDAGLLGPADLETLERIWGTDQAPGSAGANIATYTGRYLTLLPENASQADVLSRERLEAFIEEERGPLLPDVPLDSLTITDAAGKEAIDIYLKTISAAHNPALTFITSEDITIAFAESSRQNNAGQLNAILRSLDNNLRILRAADAPAEVAPLHQMLIAASESLLANVQLLADMKKDFVGGLIGAKNIEDLGAVFNDISQQITALETKYELE